MSKTRQGPKKVRIPGTNRWVPADSPEALLATLPTAPPEEDEDPFDLGPRPEPEAKPVAPPQDFPHYYHAYLPNLRVRRGRKDQVIFRGGMVFPKSAAEEARVRKALVKYVPGGDPDRWQGDTPGLTEDLRCSECGFFTRNLHVWLDHKQHTKHAA